MPSNSKQQRIQVTCPHCGKVASAPAEYAGRRVKCAAASCHRSFDLPPPKEQHASALPKAPNSSPQKSHAPIAEVTHQDRSAPAPPLPALGNFTATVASNPGNVPFNPLKWWRYQPMSLVIGGGFAVLMFVLWFGLTLAGMKATIATRDGGESPIWWLGVSSLVVVGLYAWLTARKFRSGDANPGVVISLNPTLIAVPTDLTQDGDEFPVVKIIRIKLTSAGGEPLRIGSRVPTVATYADPPHKHAGHWSDFYPYPAEYVTSDQRVLQRLLASFPKEQYKFLEQMLALIEQPYQPGLYAMWEAPGKPAGRRINKPRDF